MGVSYRAGYQRVTPAQQVIASGAPRTPECGDEEPGEYQLEP